MTEYFKTVVFLYYKVYQNKMDTIFILKRELIKKI